MSMKNLSGYKFGMCIICNKAKWSHTSNQEVFCTEQILRTDTIKNEIKTYQKENKVICINNSAR